MWENHRIEDVATPYAWERDPRLVWEFYQGRRRQLLEVMPNPAHEALVVLENYLEEFVLITQNVDDLHTKAGSEKLIHMHGELCKLRCEICGEVVIAMDENQRRHITIESIDKIDPSTSSSAHVIDAFRDTIDSSPSPTTGDSEE